MTDPERPPVEPLREAAQRVVDEARAVDVPGSLLVSIAALDEALRAAPAPQDTLGRGRVTNRKLDMRLKENRHG